MLKRQLEIPYSFSCLFVNPSKSKRITWGFVQSLFAIGLLLAGGLKPLQTISLVAAFPFIFIIFYNINIPQNHLFVNPFNTFYYSF